MLPPRFKRSNPSFAPQISRLGLHCPRYIATSSSDHRYKLPQQLEEFKLVCPAEMKPLVLLALLQHIPKEVGRRPRAPCAPRCRVGPW